MSPSNKNIKNSFVYWVVEEEGSEGEKVFLWKKQLKTLNI